MQDTLVASRSSAPDERTATPPSRPPGALTGSGLGSGRLGGGGSGGGRRGGVGGLDGGGLASGGNDGGSTGGSGTGGLCGGGGGNALNILGTRGGGLCIGCHRRDMGRSDSSSDGADCRTSYTTERQLGLAPVLDASQLQCGGSRAATS